MVKLLSNSVDEDNSREFTSEEVKINPILKKLAPEKQAISAEELVHLLKADQLALLNPEVAASTTEQEESSKENLSSSDTEQTQTNLSNIEIQDSKEVN